MTRPVLNEVFETLGLVRIGQECLCRWGGPAVALFRVVCLRLGLASVFCLEVVVVCVLRRCSILFWVALTLYCVFVFVSGSVCVAVAVSVVALYVDVF